MICLARGATLAPHDPLHLVLNSLVIVTLDFVVQVVVLRRQVLVFEQRLAVKIVLSTAPDFVVVPREPRISEDCFGHRLTLVHHVVDAEGSSGWSLGGMGAWAQWV